MKNCLNIVVTGNVDSGKSTLIGRFLHDTGSLYEGAVEEIKDFCQNRGIDFEYAYLLDSLEEEWKGKLTMDTTQVFVKSFNFEEFVFIDVPGHKELLKNMLCGSSYADIALLVIDMQKPIGEQTKRHAFILKFLGIENVILVFNKMDTCGFSKDVFCGVRDMATGLFKEIGLQTLCSIPVSAKDGINLVEASKQKTPWYEGGALLSLFRNFIVKGNKEEWLRFPVQDIYIHGGKKIAVGEISSGKIKRGEKVFILPLNTEHKISAILKFDKNRSSARAPESIGLILDNMDDLKRGQVICKERLPFTGKSLKAKIFCVSSIQEKGPLILKCATQKVKVGIKEISRVWDTNSLELKRPKGSLEETDIAELALCAENTIVTDKFGSRSRLGRFILENNKNEICAIGIVL